MRYQRWGMIGLGIGGLLLSLVACHPGNDGKDVVIIKPAQQLAYPPSPLALIEKSKELGTTPTARSF